LGSTVSDAHTFPPEGGQYGRLTGKFGRLSSCGRGPQYIRYRLPFGGGTYVEAASIEQLVELRGVGRVAVASPERQVWHLTSPNVIVVHSVTGLLLGELIV
jgi:hypothetical protein